MRNGTHAPRFPWDRAKWQARTEPAVRVGRLYGLMAVRFRPRKPTPSPVNPESRWKPAIRWLQDFYYTDLSGMQNANVGFQPHFLGQFAPLHSSLAAQMSVLSLPMQASCCLPVHFLVYVILSVSRYVSDLRHT